MKILNIATLIATASVALVAATPATASYDAASAAAVTPANSDQQRQAQDSKRYCVTLEATTGSRLSQRKCLTKAEWETLGVDVATK